MGAGFTLVIGLIDTLEREVDNGSSLSAETINGKIWRG